MLLPVVVHIVLMLDDVISLGERGRPVLLLLSSTTTVPVLQDFFVIYILILIITVKVVIHRVIPS